MNNYCMQLFLAFNELSSKSVFRSLRNMIPSDFDLFEEKLDP